MSYHKELVRVDNVFLGREDHGIFTCWISLDAGAWQSAFGGIPFDSYDDKLKKRVAHVRGTDFLMRILDLFGVDELRRIMNEPVFVLLAHPNSGKVLGLEAPSWRGNKQFILDEWCKQWDDQ